MIRVHNFESRRIALWKEASLQSHCYYISRLAVDGFILCGRTGRTISATSQPPHPFRLPLIMMSSIIIPTIILPVLALVMIISIAIEAASVSAFQTSPISTISLSSASSSSSSSSSSLPHNLFQGNIVGQLRRKSYPYLFRTSRRKAVADENDEVHFLLKDFATASGEVINPYSVLNVSRNADKKQIRHAYLQLSKRYHPDGVRFREVLPGKCNNQDDVRAEWERICISYEILSEKKTRKRYDRHEFVAKPGDAVGRAVLDATGSGIESIGKMMFSMGAATLDLIIGNNNENKNANSSNNNNDSDEDDESIKIRYEQKRMTYSLHPDK